MDAEKKVLTPIEVAEQLGVNRKTVYTMLQQNLLPHVRCGDKYLIGRVAFEKWLEGNQAKAGAGNSAA